MGRAEERCECTGQCGLTHKGTGGRCPIRHEGWHGRKRMVLAIAPADPTVPLSTMSTMTASQLLAWCAGCLDGVKRNARVADAPEGDSLF